MSDEDRDFLVDTVEREILWFTDFQGIGVERELAQRIINRLIDVFTKGGT